MGGDGVWYIAKPGSEVVKLDALPHNVDGILWLGADASDW